MAKKDKYNQSIDEMEQEMRDWEEEFNRRRAGIVVAEKDDSEVVWSDSSLSTPSYHDALANLEQQEKRYTQIVDEMSKYSFDSPEYEGLLNERTLIAFDYVDAMKEVERTTNPQNVPEIVAVSENPEIKTLEGQELYLNELRAFRQDKNQRINQVTADYKQFSGLGEDTKDLEKRLVSLRAERDAIQDVAFAIQSGIEKAKERNNEYIKEQDQDLEETLGKIEKETIGELSQLRSEFRGTEIEQEGREAVGEVIDTAKETFEELKESGRENIQDLTEMEALRHQIEELRKQNSELISLITEQNAKPKEEPQLTTKAMVQAVKRDTIEAANRVKETTKGYVNHVKDKVVNLYKDGRDKVVGFAESTKSKALNELDKAGKYFKFQASKIMAEYHLKMEKMYDRNARPLEKIADRIEQVAEAKSRAKMEIKNVFRALAGKERKEDKHIGSMEQKLIDTYRGRAEQLREKEAGHREKIEMHMEKMENLYSHDKTQAIEDKIKEAESQVKEQNNLVKDTRENRSVDLEDR